MDPHGRIYRSDDVPAEDAARLDGYLRGKAEEDELKRLRAEAPPKAATITPAEYTRFSGDAAE